MWLITGRGRQFFCFTRDDVAEAIGKIAGLIEMTGDSVVDGPALDKLDGMLQNFNNPNNWMGTYWCYRFAEVGRPIIQIEAWVIQPAAMAKALCTVGQRWLES